MFLLELEFLLDRVLMMLDQSFGWRRSELLNTSIVQILNRLIESISINVVSLDFNLGLQVHELLLD